MKPRGSKNYFTSRTPIACIHSQIFRLRKVALREARKEKHVSNWNVYHQHYPLYTQCLQLEIENFSDWANIKWKLCDVGSPFWQTINIVYENKLANHKSHYNLWQTMKSAMSEVHTASSTVVFACSRLFLLFFFITQQQQHKLLLPAFLLIYVFPWTVKTHKYRL